MSSNHSSNSTLLSLRHVCELLDASPSSVRRWSEPDYKSPLPVYRIGKKGHRRWKQKEVMEWAGLEEENSSSSIIIYSRVSTSEQGRTTDCENGKESNLTRQVERLKQYSAEQYNEPNPIIYSDCGSGLNYERKNFVKLFKNILESKYDNSTLIVEYSDRLSRFSVPLLKLILKAHNIKLVCTQSKPDKSSDEELVADMLAITSIFSAKVNGARSAKTTAKHLDKAAVDRLHDLRTAGLGYQAIADVLSNEGYVCHEGSPITCNMVRKHYKGTLELVEITKGSSIQAYVDENIEIAGQNTRILSRVLYQDYLEWVYANKKEAESITQFGKFMSKRHQKLNCYDSRKENRSSHGFGYVGISVKGKKLHFTVNSKRSPKPAAKDNSFTSFYHEELKGKFQGYRDELDQAYKDYCHTNNLKPIPKPRIPATLRSIGGKSSTPTIKVNRKWYDLR